MKKRGYEIGNLKPMIDLSTFCNAQCPQCHRTNQGNIEEKIFWLPLIQTNLELFKKRFPEKDMYLYQDFIFCGSWGDPMMAKDIYEITEYVLENSNAGISINTNGGMRDEDFWFKFGQLSSKGYEWKGRLTVIFDIDGYTDEQHQKYRRNVSLQKVLNHMDAFMENPYSLSKVFTVVFEHNENDIDKIAELAKQHGAYKHMVCPSNRFRNATNGNNFRFKYKNKIESLHRSTKMQRYYEVDL